MKDISEDKIGESKEELEIESEEKDRGEEIEVDEDRLPSRAMAIHEHIRRDGKRDGARRDGPAVVRHCSRSVDGRLSARQRDISRSAGRRTGRVLLENLGYTFGFIIVIMARQQLLRRIPSLPYCPSCKIRPSVISVY